MEVSNNEANTGKSVCSQSTMVSQVGDEITKETLVHKAESDSVRDVGYSKDSNAVADLKAVETQAPNFVSSSVESKVQASTVEKSESSTGSSALSSSKVVQSSSSSSSSSSSFSSSSSSSFSASSFKAASAASSSSMMSSLLAGKTSLLDESLLGDFKQKIDISPPKPPQRKEEHTYVANITLPAPK